jgi:processing peptidase subunit beta
VLTQKIATDNLADAFMAFNTNYHDAGLFGVYAVTDRARSESLAWTVMNEVRVCCVFLCQEPSGGGQQLA